MTLPSTAKLIPFESAAAMAKTLANKQLVFTNGCFDILHAGHIYYLQQAKALGDYLWVGLNADASVKQLKGDTRPINFEAARAYVLAGLEAVDFITIFSQNTPIELITNIKPNIHVKGGDYKKETLPEYPVVKGYGGQVIIQPFLTGFSTTSIIDQSRQS